MSNIVWKKPAINFLRKIDKGDSKRIVRKINEEVSKNVKRHLKFLVNKGFYKIRIGDYRLFVDYVKEEEKLIIDSIKHRKNAYK